MVLVPRCLVDCPFPSHVKNICRFQVVSSGIYHGNQMVALQQLAGMAVLCPERSPGCINDIRLQSIKINMGVLEPFCLRLNRLPEVSQRKILIDFLVTIMLRIGVPFNVENAPFTLKSMPVMTDTSFNNADRR